MMIIVKNKINIFKSKNIELGKWGVDPNEWK